MRGLRMIVSGESAVHFHSSLGYVHFPQETMNRGPAHWGSRYAALSADYEHLHARRGE